MCVAKYVLKVSKDVYPMIGKMIWASREEEIWMRKEFFLERKHDEKCVIN